MNINERIKGIKEYFNLFNVTEEGSYVLVTFGKKWIVPNDVYTHIRRGKTNKAEGQYYFMADTDVDPSDIFDAVEYVIDYNKELIAKSELFAIKIKELQTIFEEESLETLNTLEFVFSTDDIPYTSVSFDKKNEEKNVSTFPDANKSMMKNHDATREKAKEKTKDKDNDKGKDKVNKANSILSIAKDIKKEENGVV